MRIGVLGTTSIEKTCTMLGKSKEEYLESLKRVGLVLARAGTEIIVVPDKESTAEEVAFAYKEHGGRKVIGVVPLQDKEFGYDWLNLDVLDEQLDCDTWRNSPERVCEESDLLLVLSYGPGVLIELSYTKWFKARVLVLEDFVSGRLPGEAVKGLDIKYSMVSALEKEIKELNG